MQMMTPLALVGILMILKMTVLHCSTNPARLAFTPHGPESVQRKDLTASGMSAGMLSL